MQSDILPSMLHIFRPRCCQFHMYSVTRCYSCPLAIVLRDSSHDPKPKQTYKLAHGFRVLVTQDMSGQGNAMYMFDLILFNLRIENILCCEVPIISTFIVMWKYGRNCYCHLKLRLASSFTFRKSTGTVYTGCFINSVTLLNCYQKFISDYI